MRFEKVSYDQYLKDCYGDTYYARTDTYNMKDFLGEGNVNFGSKFKSLREESLGSVYDSIKLPARATKKSAGYDFFAPYDFSLAPGETIKLATGIRVILDDDKFLACFPRSGHGFKSRIQLDNTVGIIDADYSDSSNEGHIYLKLTNDSMNGSYLNVEKGDGIMQAIILPYFRVEDDNVDTLRDGGLGSTNK